MSASWAPPVLSAAFGVLMVVAAQPQHHRLASVAAVLAVTSVALGVQFRFAATLAVLLTVITLAISDPPTVLTAVSGLSATAYLVLRHSAGPVRLTVTMPTAVAALGFGLAVASATFIPFDVPWLALLAPFAVLGAYLLTTRPFLHDARPDRSVGR